MSDPLAHHLKLTEALRLTGDPPRPWVAAAEEIPRTLGDLQALGSLLDSEAFRERFAADPQAAVIEVGLPATRPVIAAVRERLATA